MPETAPPIFGTYFDEKALSDPDFWPKSVIQAVFLPLREKAGGASGVSGVQQSAEERWPGYGTVQGRLLRAPILRAFADARAPDEVREWVASIAEWKFDRVLTAHFASPIRADANDFRAAFAYLNGPTAEPPIVCEDWALLDGLNALIDTNKLGAPVKFDFKAGCKSAS